MPVLKEIFDKKMDYRRCLPADIGPHFDQIKHWIEPEIYENFLGRMLTSVEGHSAWQSENTFLYYTKENERQALGVAIFGMGYPLEMLALFTGIFYFEDRKTAMLRFALHSDKMISEYKALLTITSMMRAHTDRTHPLMIRVDAFRDKMVKLLDGAIKK